MLKKCLTPELHLFAADSSSLAPVGNHR
jgi:hypothetical protein